MNIFDTNTIIVKENLRFLKFGNVFEFFDEQGVKLGEAKEEKIGFWRKLFKLTNLKTLLPFDITIYGAQGEKLLSISRPFSIWLSEVVVSGSQGEKLGYYKQRFRIFKPKFELRDNTNQIVGSIVGDFVAWNFTIKSKDGQELGIINKKFAGIAKEMFTTADNYMVSFNDMIMTSEHKKLLVGLAVIIDMVFKEYGG